VEGINDSILFTVIFFPLSIFLSYFCHTSSSFPQFSLVKTEKRTVLATIWDHQRDCFSVINEKAPERLHESFCRIRRKKAGLSAEKKNCMSSLCWCSIHKCWIAFEICLYSGQTWCLTGKLSSSHFIQTLACTSLSGLSCQTSRPNVSNWLWPIQSGSGQIQ